MNRYIYRIPVIILIMDIISAVISYFWIDSIHIILPMCALTFISFVAFLITIIENITLYEDIFVNGSGYMIFIFFACLIYAFVSFFVGLAYLKDGSPAIVNGVYYLDNKGLLKEISENAYRRLVFGQNRFISGFILAFGVLPVPTYLQKLKQLSAKNKITAVQCPNNRFLK